jgi:hypothetical protein
MGKIVEFEGTRKIEHTITIQVVRRGKEKWVEVSGYPMDKAEAIGIVEMAKKMILDSKIEAENKDE